MRKGKLDAVGLIVPDDLRPFGNAFFVDQVTSLSNTLAASGLDLMLVAAERGEAERATLQRLVEGRRVDGMIVMRTLRHDPRVDYLLEQGLPFVCHGRTENPDGYAFVDLDGDAAGRIATEELIALGHRDIAFIGPPSSILTYAWHRRSGYAAVLARHGIPLRTSLVREGEGGEVFGERATTRLLADVDRPSAMICATDLEAIGAIRAIAAAGLVAGRDISVIGHDDLPEAALTQPPLATLKQPHAAVGARLAEIIAALVGGGQPTAFQEIWQPELILRDSIGPAPIKAFA